MTLESYFLERLSPTTYYLSKNQKFSFFKLAGVKKNGVEKIVPFDIGPARQRGSGSPLSTPHSFF